MSKPLKEQLFPKDPEYQGMEYAIVKVGCYVPNSVPFLLVSCSRLHTTAAHTTISLQTCLEVQISPG